MFPKPFTVSPLQKAASEVSGRGQVGQPATDAASAFPRPLQPAGAAIRIFRPLLHSTRCCSVVGEDAAGPARRRACGSRIAIREVVLQSRREVERNSQLLDLGVVSARCHVIGLSVN